MQNSNPKETKKNTTLNQPIITVLTPNYNTEIEIIEFLDSIKKQDYTLESIEIIIIDNGSTDKSLQNVRAWFAKNRLFYKTKLIELKKNLGIAQAYNEGYNNRSSESEIIVRTESDVELESHCLSTLVHTLLSDNNYGIVGARGVFFYDKKTINHAARYLNWWNGVVTEFDPLTLTECDFVFGGTFAVKTEIIRKMTYFFKKDKFLANELEICTRVSRQGYKILCQPSAISYHKGGHTTGKLISNKFHFIYLRETTLFHLEFNYSFKKFTSLSFLFLASFKQIFLNNNYALRGFISALFSYTLKKDILLPWKNKNELISVWLME